MAISCGARQTHTEGPHVIFIGIDGLGSHNLWPTDSSIVTPETPNINRLMAESAYSKRASIDRRNWSGPNWGSMLTGEDSDTHKIISNDCVRSAIPTIFDQVAERASQLDAGMVANWSQLACYSQEGSLDFSQILSNDSEAIANTALDTIKEREPNMLFVYFGDVDEAGHRYGARSEEYRTTIENVDAAIGSIIDYLQQNQLYDSTQIILSADHGHATNAEGHSDAQHPVPLIIKSNKITPGEITTSVANRVVAPSILWMLDLEPRRPF